MSYIHLPAGIIALATILSDPKKMPEARGMKQFYKVSSLFDSVALRVTLRY